MYCEKCGQQLSEDAKFCDRCGQKVEESNEGKADDFNPSEKKNRKSNIYLLLSGIILVLFALAFCFWFGFKNERDVKEHKDYMETAEKYIEELDYEKAEATYLNAIEIEPKKKEPYLKLAKIYMKQGKYDKAEEILEKADATGVKGTAEQEREEEQIKEQIKEEKKTKNYKWSINPTIEADDIYYLADYPDYGAPLNDVCKQADNSRAVIQREDQYGIIDLNGKLLADVEYKNIYNFGENYMMEKTIPEYEEEFGCEWEVYWLNEDGKVQADVGSGEIFLTYYYYHEGDVCAAGYIEDNSTETMPVQQSEQLADEDSSPESFLDNLDGKYAIEDEGRLVTDFVYDECGSESEGLLAVCKNGKWGYVDKQGNIVIPIEYDASWEQYPVLDSNYSRSTDCVKDYCYAASDGYVVLKKDNEWELRDTDGELVIEPGFFEEMRPVFDKKCWVKKDGKWGVIELITSEAEDPEEETSQEISYEMLEGIWLQEDSVDAIQFTFELNDEVRYNTTVSLDLDYTTTYYLENNQLVLDVVNPEYGSTVELKYYLEYSENEKVKICKLSPSEENENADISGLYGVEELICGTYIQIKLEQVKQLLEISDDLEIYTEQSDVWYSEDEGIYMTDVLYETSDVDVWASAIVDALTGELMEDVIMCSE